MKFINIWKLVFFSVIISIVVACEQKEVFYDFPETNNTLVVYCFFNPDSIWKAHVSKVGEILNTNVSELYLSKATVSIVENSTVIDTLVYDRNGFYLSSKGLKPNFGNSYKIQVSCDGFDDVVSNAERLPENINIDSIDYKDYLIPDVFPSEIYIMQESQSLEFHSVSMTLSNTAEDQFYKVFLAGSDGREKEGVELSSHSQNEFIEYYSWQCSVLQSIHSGISLLEFPIISDFHHSLNFFTISESYVLYELSYAEFDFVISTSYLLTPKNIFSNIQGGVGVMAGYTSNTVYLSNY